MKRHLLSIGFLISAVLAAGCAKKSFDALYSEAQTSYKEGHYVEAIDSVNSALSRWSKSNGDEKKGQAYQLLGQSYHALKKIDESIDAYNQAIKFSTNTYPAAYDLGVLLLTKSESKAATDAFEAALNMKPNDPMALVGLGNAYFGMAAYTQARAAYNKLLDTSPGVRESLEYLTVVNNKLSGKRPAAPAAAASKKKKPTLTFESKKKKKHR